MADSYLQALAAQNHGEFPDDPDTIEEVQGQIGTGAAMTLFNFVKLAREQPKFEEIVKDPEKVRVPKTPDAQMLVCYNLAHRVDDKTVAPVIKYIERMPKEFAVTFAKAACKRNMRLVVSPAMSAWANSNASLMAAIGA